ncbi:TonB-dependent receptor plug domain-containing protein [Aliarcobacter butzleri]|uniref:TonB-dependent receptor plug domain-containing protein n=1 Tax=Aliarcobacter butzleri TaxID=28197 RepID=UPI0021B2266D|nr:TonB-dependent receptor [Aliarcobacter butzleri]MCT7594038.1 TonB-dependent receptor [Aliarcobacter butzleri]MCT7599506.1 TonB-dependent receptor [Aliarcobacter butzleri]MCT7651553.1 TonB-dependent receptor [Aliarcobacter butzleri]
MKKIISLSLIATAILGANETTTLKDINVVEKVNSELIKDISNEELKSADLADALMKNSPNISIVRRNGIANDIILRGQKKDNINILIDGAKIYGGCPNRMDPPTSHIVTNNIESVKIIEGPYDVENFGTLSGLVKVDTVEPKEGFNGEINLNAGSFGYKKASTTVSGGNDFVKALISASTEKGDQYKDGNGDDFLQQQIKRGVPYANQYKKDDLDAFEKKSILSKLQFNLTDDQDLKLSYTANRSDGILYPAGSMDADYDDSDIYTLGYTIRELGSLSKQLDLDYYYSKVDHPMSTDLRNRKMSPTSMMTMPVMVSQLKTFIWGTKVKNSLDIKDYLVTFGLDTSVRNWRAVNTSNPSIPSTDTTNKAIFTKVAKSFGSLDLEFGSRYDYTDIDTTKVSTEDKKYVGLNANIFAVYNVDEESKVFAGIGKSSRVPDARELYHSTAGNKDLEQTQNYEADLGFEKTIGSFFIKPKIFYSELKDYIYNTGTFGNIDAKIYGLDVSGFYYLTEDLSFDYGVAYLKGKKDGEYTGNDKDLAEIAPLKANFAVTYEYAKSKFKAEVIAVDRWDSYDARAREQELAGYAVVNLKYTQALFKHFEVTLGVDNLFDKVYNSTNTYQDITYVQVGSERVLFNDPGRYGYVNLKYSF